VGLVVLVCRWVVVNANSRDVESIRLCADRRASFKVADVSRACGGRPDSGLR